MNLANNQQALILLKLTNVVRRFMEAEGLTFDLLENHINSTVLSERLPVADWWNLLECLSKLTGDPHVGLRIGGFAQVQDGGLLGYLAASCETIGQLMSRWHRYERLLQNLTVSSIEMNGNNIRLVWFNENGYSTDLSNEVFISGLLTVLRILVFPHRLEPVCVEFPRKGNSGRQVYEASLECPVKFDCARLAISLRTQDLLLPINSRDTSLMHLLEQQAAIELKELEDTDDFLKRLELAMTHGLLEGHVSAQWVAVQLKMPVRSVFRSLNERGKTFKGQLNELRLRLAQRYLMDNTLSLSEIALLLGYSEQSAFNRAFRSWTGITPLARRREFQ